MSHDTAYKKFFSYPNMVQDLLLEFVKEDWVKQLDFGTLERVNASYVAKKLQERHADVIWKVAWKDLKKPPLYIYLMLEFQTKDDPVMALRVMSYLSLFYLDLAEQMKFKKSDLLPPVLPLVLYRGKAPWGSSTSVQQLIAHPPGQLKQYLPRLRYGLIEERQYDSKELLKIAKPVAALFGLEQGQTLDETVYVLTLLFKWLGQDEQQSLSRTFSEWISGVYLKDKLPEVQIEKIENLLEVKNMMQRNAKTWTEQWRMEGMAKGMAEGKAKGMAEGKIEGEALVLNWLIERKFGRLPQTFREKLGSAREPQLKRWAQRILTASTLEQVFSTRKRAS